jgi:hypothetical protein
VISLERADLDLGHQQRTGLVDDLVNGNIGGDSAAFFVAQRLQLREALPARVEWQTTDVRSEVDVVVLGDTIVAALRTESLMVG